MSFYRWRSWHRKTEHLSWSHRVEQWKSWDAQLSLWVLPLASVTSTHHGNFISWATARYHFSITQHLPSNLDPGQLRHLQMLKLPKAVWPKRSTEICTLKQKDIKQGYPPNIDFNWILHVSAREECTSLSLFVKTCILVEFSLHKSAEMVMHKALWKQKEFKWRQSGHGSSQSISPLIPPVSIVCWCMHSFTAFWPYFSFLPWNQPQA